VRPGSTDLAHLLHTVSTAAVDAEGADKEATMTKKLLTAAATGIVGLVLGAGIGMAAAGDDPGPAPAGAASHDAVHAAMRADMPEDLAARCDEVHAAMPDGMGSMDPGAIGSMMGAGGHASHHR
jgi:hypothetical protein